MLSHTEVYDIRLAHRGGERNEELAVKHLKMAMDNGYEEYRLLLDEIVEKRKLRK